LRELDLMGHTIQITTGGFGGYQAIMVDHVNKTFIGASESRKDGQAAGY
jgi:gamma-glutamyltranspeptidase/glutathione hydrolase